MGLFILNIIAAVCWGLCFIISLIEGFMALSDGDVGHGLFRLLFATTAGLLCGIFVLAALKESEPKMRTEETTVVQVDTVFTTTNGITDTTYVVKYLK